MKNITLKVDDETYQKARKRALEQGTSVSAMVRDFLNGISYETIDREERENRRLAELDEIYRLSDESGKVRSEPLVPMTRKEIYAERIR